MSGAVPHVGGAIGQISRPVALHLLECCYSEYEMPVIIKRVMLGERMRIRVCARVCFVWRDTDFDSWWLFKDEK